MIERFSANARLFSNFASTVHNVYNRIKQKRLIKMLVFPNAKINLGLNIIEKRLDGYHNLETIFYPVPLEDALEIHLLTDATAEKCRLHQTGKTIEGSPEQNLIVKAYRLLDDIFDLPSVEVYLHKCIPSGAGLGGGSSDAAFMLKLLNKKFELHLTEETLEEYAAMLGADCAFFIRNCPTYAEGIGNLFSPLPSALSSLLKGWNLWLVKPDIFVSTKQAFAQIHPHKPTHPIREIVQQPIKTWKESLINDFEESVFAQFPPIKEIKEEMYRQGAVYASMSGSGSSVYGLFKDGFTQPSGDFFGVDVQSFYLQL